jgi:hypothetical protein
MTITQVRCGCGAVELQLIGQPGDLLPSGRFNPEFHVHCRFAAARIEDGLPHYKDRPTKFRGSGELMSW